MQLKIRQRATDRTVDDTRPHHTQRPDGRPYSQQVYGMGENNTTSSSGGSDKGWPKLEVYRLFVTILRTVLIAIPVLQLRPFLAKLII